MRSHTACLSLEKSGRLQHEAHAYGIERDRIWPSDSVLTLCRGRICPVGVAPGSAGIPAGLTNFLCQPGLCGPKGRENPAQGIGR